jgi:16S rRNA (uracil1498-N3)-methyltransferase
MFVFYSNQIDTDSGTLSEEELHHCVHVLRYKEGDNIFVTNGNGLFTECIIKRITKSMLHFEVISSKLHEDSRIKNGIAISPPKSADRLEWFIEKAIEIGIRYIYLFDCTRTEKSHPNLKRLLKIAVSAMKQSKQFYLAEIKVLKNFSEVLKHTEDYQEKYIAFCDIKETQLIDKIQNDSKIILIGPEGDFTIDEVNQASEKGFIPVSLGKNILRTETAGVYSATIFESKRIS